ncbi:MAG: type II toxin-antitoxin system antitoxin SocA domain-containing protein [Acidobacteriota bacterium]
MPNVHDTAAYILARRGEMTAMKLQKLVYYSQVWSLVWDEDPLFRERVEAWANGPVVPALYQEHRGRFKVHSWSKGQPDRLAEAQKETVDAVLRYYGDRSSQWLSDLTHSEAPWRDARRGLAPGDRGKREISKAAMAEFYSGLASDFHAEGQA